jgi:hypothetical protein
MTTSIETLTAAAIADARSFADRTLSAPGYADTLRTASGALTLDGVTASATPSRLDDLIRRAFPRADFDRVELRARRAVYRSREAVALAEAHERAFVARALELGASAATAEEIEARIVEDVARYAEEIARSYPAA